MVAQVVLAPFVAAESGSVLAHWHRLRALTGVSIVYLAIGSYGGLITIFDYRKTDGIHWVAVPVGWFFLQVLRLDLDGKPDPIPLFVFCSLGIAIVADNLGAHATEKTRLTDGTIFIFFITALLLVISLPITGLPPVTNQEQNLAEQLFWSGERISQCHMQMSQTEQLWIERTPALPSDEACWTPSWGEIINRVSWPR
jgi:hypothetical protein